MFQMIRIQHQLLRQLSTEVSIAPPTEAQLKVSRIQQATRLGCIGFVEITHALIILSVPFGFFFLFSFLSQDPSLGHLVLVKTVVGFLFIPSSILFFWLGCRVIDLVFSRWATPPALYSFYWSDTQILTGSDCERALELIAQLQANGAPEYQAAVLAQHRPFYGFDLRVLQRVSMLRRHGQETQHQKQAELASKEACRTLNGLG